jgi:hypothetical protein
VAGRYGRRRGQKWGWDEERKREVGTVVGGLELYLGNDQFGALGGIFTACMIKLQHPFISKLELALDSNLMGPCESNILELTNKESGRLNAL